CETKVFDQQVKLDDSRNLLTSKFVIRVESLVYGFFSSSLGDEAEHASTIKVKPTSGTRRTAVDRMQIIKNLLNQPRKDFWYATHHNRREDDESEDVYQILIAATGSDIGSEDDPEYFKDIQGDELVIRFKDGYTD